MFQCAQCTAELVRQKTGEGIVWDCPNCGGRLASLALVRKSVPRSLANDLWQRARANQGRSGRGCPCCSAPMIEVRVDEAMPVLDICVRCQMLWFDPTEYDVLPRLQLKAPDETPLHVKQALGVMQVEWDRQRKQATFEVDEWPEDDWKLLPAALGFPVEQGQEPLTGVPWLTWGLSAALVVVGTWALFAGIGPIAQAYGFVPAQPSRLAGLTFVTAFFLHGGFLHLFSNLYFLLVFGDNVEDYLGKERFLILLLGATLFGDLAHLLAESGSTLPCIGASGGISGVIAFYTLKFPHVRLGFLVHVYFRIQWLKMPVYVAFGLWLLLQAFGAWQQFAGFTHVSALAHLGGAATGFVCWLLYRER